MGKLRKVILNARRATFLISAAKGSKEKLVFEKKSTQQAIARASAQRYSSHQVAIPPDALGLFVKTSTRAIIGRFLRNFLRASSRLGISGQSEEPSAKTRQQMISGRSRRVLGPPSRRRSLELHRVPHK